MQKSDIAKTAENSASDLSFEWPRWAWLIALLPFFQAILTWSLDGKLSGAQYAMRHFSIPAVTGEILIVVFAVKSNLSISSTIKQIPMLAKLSILIWLTFAVASFLSTFEQWASSAYLLLRYILHGVFFASIIRLIRISKTFEMKKWLNVITLGTIFYIALIAMFAILVPDPTSFDWIQRMPSATNIRQIAIIMGICATAPIALLLYGEKPTDYAAAMMLIAIITFIAWSGTRTAIISTVFSIVIAIIFVRSLPKMRAIAIMIGSFAVGCLISITLPSPANSFGLLRLVTRFHERDNFSSGRVEFWYQTLAEIQKSPWIGYGSGRFRDNMDALYGNRFNHPHNFVLQFAYDWGIIGLGAAAVLITYMMWVIWRNANAYPLAGFAASAGILALLASASIEGALFHPLPIIAALALIAPLFANINKSAMNNIAR